MAVTLHTQIRVSIQFPLIIIFPPTKYIFTEGNFHLALFFIYLWPKEVVEYLYITYPTVVMVTTAHQNPSQAPFTNFLENSLEKKTNSCKKILFKSVTCNNQLPVQPLSEDERRSRQAIHSCYGFQGDGFPSLA